MGLQTSSGHLPLTPGDTEVIFLETSVARNSSPSSASGFCHVQLTHPFDFNRKRLLPYPSTSHHCQTTNMLNNLSPGLGESERLPRGSDFYGLTVIKRRSQPGRVRECCREGAHAGEIGRSPAFPCSSKYMHRPATLASAGSLLEMKNFRPDSRFIESESAF